MGRAGEEMICIMVCRVGETCGGGGCIGYD